MTASLAASAGYLREIFRKTGASRVEPEETSDEEADADVGVKRLALARLRAFAASLKRPRGVVLIVTGVSAAALTVAVAVGVFVWRARAATEPVQTLSAETGKLTPSFETLSLALGQGRAAKSLAPEATRAFDEDLQRIEDEIRLRVERVNLELDRELNAGEAAGAGETRPNKIEAVQVEEKALFPELQPGVLPLPLAVNRPKGIRLEKRP